MQSVSPSHRHRMGMHKPSILHWNSSVWQPPGGRVAVEEDRKWTCNYNTAWEYAYKRHRYRSYYLTIMTAGLPDVKNQFPGMETVTSVRHHHNKLWTKANFLMSSGPGLALWRPSLGIGHKGFPSWQRLASGRVWRGGSGKPDLVCKQREVCPRTESAGVNWPEWHHTAQAAHSHCNIVQVIL